MNNFLAQTNPNVQLPDTNPGIGSVFGNIVPPKELNGVLQSSGEAGIGAVLSRVIEIVYIFAAILVIFYILYSAIQLIYSEGEKERVAEARGRITWAIIGMIILALAFVILKVLGHILNFTFFG